MNLPSFRTVLRWIDDNILILLGGFLLAFIPLYPKLPLFDVLPGYIVRVRVEDFLILFTGFVWLIQMLRRKVPWKTPVFWMIVAYAVVGLLSVISAVVITKTVPAEALHIGKTALHYFRYLEYFSLFIILYSAISNKTQVKILAGVIAITVLVLTIYGYGQKYFYWPVYSTMNREFSKGIRLYLTDHARVQSTFGGHYDLAAYLVITLPIILALAFNVKNIALKIFLQVVHWVGVWLIIVSGSRSSFFGYLIGVFIVILFTALNQKTWPKKIFWGLSRGIIVFAVIAFMLLKFGDEMYDRFVQVIQGYPEVYVHYAVFEKQADVFINETIPVTLGLKDLPVPTAQVPDGAISTDEAAALEGIALVPSDERPVSQRPSDVFVDVPDLVEVATISASGEATTVLVDNGPRVYSDCALKRGLSTCIRIETLWPRAIEGFKRNPIFGSGYATLTKEDVGQFTEAESTDNNFLRTLGETGLLGFITFYGVTAIILWLVVRQLWDTDNIGRALSIGLLGATVGLLINAVYIDVFAASKVAFTYWGIAGVIVAYTRLNHPELLEIRPKKKETFTDLPKDSESKTETKPASKALSSKTTKRTKTTAKKSKRV